MLYHMQILKYLLCETKTVVQTWRHRVYNVCSSHKLKLALVDLIEWADKNKDRRTRLVLKLKDKENCYKILGDSLLKFFTSKPNVFKHAVESKEAFWKIPQWKRAIAYVFLIRQFISKHANRAWDAWTESDYSFSVKHVDRYLT